MWRDKLRPGYLYMIGGDVPVNPGERSFVACTGYGGAINYGEALEKNGLPDDFIQGSIKITPDETIVTGQVWTRIRDIYWAKTIEDTEP